MDLLETLVKMADKYDQEGAYDLAEEVDLTIESLGSVRAPLKHLDSDVKKNLIIFVHDAGERTDQTLKDLQELLRRLRYFGFDDVKGIGLEKAIKDLEKTRDELVEAKKRFYEITHGKRPSKSDLETLLKEVEEAMETDKEQNALDFFDAHKDGLECQECESEEDPDEEEIDIFLVELEDEEHDTNDY